MSIVMAVDPGPTYSTWLLYSSNGPHRVLDIHRDMENPEVRGWLQLSSAAVVCENVECFGMAVGVETFETVRWIGRYEEICSISGVAFTLLGRSRVKSHLCHAANANDSEVRMALIDRFGPGKDQAVGTKVAPGPLHGVAGHAWSALALAVTWCDLRDAETDARA